MNNQQTEIIALLHNSITDAETQAGKAATPEEAYKRFMDRFGEGIIEVFAKALADSTSLLAQSSGKVVGKDEILKNLQKGPVLSLCFPTPGLAPLTQKTVVKQGSPSAGGGGAAPLGVSISVGGSWSF